MGMDVYGRCPKPQSGRVRKPQDIDMENSTEEQIFAYYDQLDDYHRSQPGAYFRASIWSWAPIHQLISKANENFYLKHNEYLFDQKELAEMSLNMGSGPDNQSTCDILADYIDVWMEHHTDGAALESPIKVKDDGTIVVGKGGDNLKSAYSVDDEHLKEWVNFLRHCGGFMVC